MSQTKGVAHFGRPSATAPRCTFPPPFTGQPWSLLQAGQVFFTMPRSALIRGFGLNHLIHHRAHLCVYLRLNDIPVPGMYGPSGDE